ncbi:hypothetical protein RDT67_06775 [Serratia fonticola]|uniref:Uncharacterized protein n=1 Tax=Serratia fonticola TaxID=47917 RepID=A0AAJ1YA89_SERFO|nr:hypothetical protein [Serratia fonticola]MDQ9126134.1 hypothetical protein [Serratia fonticola]
MANLFNTLMIRTGQRLLQQYRYPDDLEWHWSLGYCQGDGCACVGTLDNAALRQLLPVLTQRQSLSIENLQALTLVLTQYPVAVLLTLNRRGGRATHAGCIQIEIPDFPDGEEALYLALYHALRQDLDTLCAVAERQGYQLLDATSPPYDSDVLFERRTRHFALRAVAETHDDGQDLAEDPALWDETLALLLEHSARLLTLRLELVCLTTGDCLARDWQSEVVITANQPVRQWFNREVLPELVQTARHAIEQKRLAYQAIRSAA